MCYTRERYLGKIKEKSVGLTFGQIYVVKMLLDVIMQLTIVIGLNIYLIKSKLGVI